MSSNLSFQGPSTSISLHYVHRTKVLEVAVSFIFLMLLLEWEIFYIPYVNRRKSAGGVKLFTVSRKVNYSVRCAGGFSINRLS